jgi:hypothetical protein
MTLGVDKGFNMLFFFKLYIKKLQHRETEKTRSTSVFFHLRS